MNDDLTGPFLRVECVAQMLGKSRQAVYWLLKNGAVPGCKLGNTWVIPRASFMKLLTSIGEHGLIRSARRKRDRMKHRRAYVKWNVVANEAIDFKDRAQSENL